MKTITFFFTLFIFSSIHAQFDDKFYYPKKEWSPIADSIDYLELSFQIPSGNISGLELIPSGDFKGNILFFHGASGNVSTYLPMTIPMAKHGYRVIMIDVRGYGKSQGTPTHVGIAADAPFILDWILQQENYQDQQLIVYGASMGTQIAANLCARFPDKFSLLVLDGAMTSFTDIALHSAPRLQQGVIKKYVTSPYAAIEDIKTIDETPVLIVHSEEDSEIPIHMANSLFEAALEPKQFYQYEGGHLEAPQKHIKELLREMEAMLR